MNLLIMLWLFLTKGSETEIIHGYTGTPSMQDTNLDEEWEKTLEEWEKNLIMENKLNEAKLIKRNWAYLVIKALQGKTIIPNSNIKPPAKIQ